MILRQIPLDVLNSATKYPSIETYHVLDARGRLTDERRDPPPGAEVYVTEKIDGTNGRIVVIGDDYVIGSRNELLTARGDHVPNPAMGIVEALRPIADNRVNDAYYAPGMAVVLYFEVYGHRIGKAAEQYTGRATVGVRLFDVAYIDGPTLRSPTAEAAATARGNGGQVFQSVKDLWTWAAMASVNAVPLLWADTVPTLRSDVLAWLPTQTRALLDGDGKGGCEGVVMRTADRSWIVKARREDYVRSLR